MILFNIKVCEIMNYYFSTEKRLTRAAKDVADTLGGDKAKTTSDLLQKVLVSRIEVLQEQEQMAKTYVKCHIYHMNHIPRSC